MFYSNNPKLNMEENKIIKQNLYEQRYYYSWYKFWKWPKNLERLIKRKIFNSIFEVSYNKLKIDETNLNDTLLNFRSDAGANYNLNISYIEKTEVEQIFHSLLIIVSQITPWELNDLQKENEFFENLRKDIPIFETLEYCNKMYKYLPINIIETCLKRYKFKYKFKVKAENKEEIITYAKTKGLYLSANLSKIIFSEEKYSKRKNEIILDLTDRYSVDNWYKNLDDKFSKEITLFKILKNFFPEIIKYCISFGAALSFIIFILKFTVIGAILIIIIFSIYKFII